MFNVDETALFYNAHPNRKMTIKEKHTTMEDRSTVDAK
jgi:hypothetical protein